MDKHLVPTIIPHRFISKMDKTTTPEVIKKEFVDQFKWYIEVWSWTQKYYLFNFEESKKDF